MAALGLAACTENGDKSLDGAAASTVVSASVSDGETAALEVQVDDGSQSQVGEESDAPAAAPDSETEPTEPADEAVAPPAETAWVVVVAGASDPFDSILTESVEELSDLGFEGRISNCDRGAAEAIGMAADTTFTVTAEFDSQDAATEAVATLAASQIEVVAAEVVVSCPE